MKRTYLLNVAILIFAVIFLLIIMEAAVRISVHKITFNLKIDQEVGILRNPGTKGINEGEYSTTNYSINSFGFREKDFNPEKPKDVYRIAVIGDSIVEAVQVEYDERFTKLLENKLNNSKSPYKFEVLNFGMDGIGTSEYYLILKKFAVKYKPDMIIVVLANNDIKQNIHTVSDKNSPHLAYFDLDDNGRLIEVPHLSSKFEPILGLMRKSNLVHYLYGKYLNFKIRYSKNSYTIPLDYGVFFKKYDSSWEKAWNLTKQMITAMKNESEQNNASFILADTTYVIQIDKDRWNLAKQEYPAIKKVEWDMEKPNRIIVGFCNEKNIECADSLNNFKIQSLKGDLYTPNDTHLSKKGHELMAQLLYEKIINKTK